MSLILDLLSIPYFSQWADGAKWRRTDCGIACLKMIFSALGVALDKTIDQLAALTGLANADVGLPASALPALAKRFNVRMHVQVGMTLSAIQAELAAGRPVIPLIAYRFISNRLDQGDNVPGADGHFLILVAYRDGVFVAKDPDYWGSTSGNNVVIFVNDLGRALAPYGGTCVLFDGEGMLTDRDNQILAIVTEMAAGANRMATLAAEVKNLVTTQPETTIPEGSYKATALEGVYVHSSPDVKVATRVGAGLSKNDVIVVSKTTTPGDTYVRGGVTFTTWREITDGPDKGHFVAAGYLTDPNS